MQESPSDVKKRKEPAFALILALASVGSMTALLFTPALPEIQDFFNISANTTKATIYLFLIAYLIGNMFYSLYSNRYGRKSALYLGMCIAILGGLVCISSYFLKHYNVLKIGRMIQAFGIVAGLQGSYTITSEGYPFPKNLKMTSYISFAYAVGPGVGIALGGALAQYFGWVGCFFFMTLLPLLLCILTIFYTPETIKEKDALSFKWSNIKKNYGGAFSDLKVFHAAAVFGFAVPFAFLFAAKAPFIVERGWEYSKLVYGLYNIIPCCFLVAGVIIVGWLIKLIRPIYLVLAGILLIALSSILIFFAFFYDFIGINTLFILYGFVLLGQTLCTASAAAFSLNQAKDKAFASSAMNVFNVGLSSVFLMVLSMSDPADSLFMPSLYLWLSFFLILVYFSMRRFCQSGKKTDDHMRKE